MNDIKTHAAITEISGEINAITQNQIRHGIIDAETCNAALSLRRMADAIEPGFNPREWLAARGL